MGHHRCNGGLIILIGNTLFAGCFHEGYSVTLFYFLRVDGAIMIHYNIYIESTNKQGIDMQAITTITNKLNEVFADMDAKVLESSQEWAKGRVAAIKEFKESDEYQSLRKNAWRLYDRLHAIAGGKTWYGVFNNNTPERIAEFIEKNCQATVSKRNATIAKKLEKAGVSEVISEEFIYTKDGFDGTFKVNTDVGTKTVHINTIYAGGYNVQCLHLRVLTKIK